jgi:ABC-type molybdenum transport system ATPase subunit/photorepair protein PhrA
MLASRGYRRFVTLIERIEKHGSRRQSETLTFRRPGGEIAGVVTVDGGRVRFGARCTGYGPIDETLQQDAPQLADALQQILDCRTLARAGQALIPPLEPSQHAALCGLTARTIRKIAEVCDPGAPADRTSGPAEPLLGLFEVDFTPAELLLAAGRCGAIDRNDPSVRLYGTPPGHAEERWLFERQPDELGAPWPIMTTRLSSKGVHALAAGGTLVQLVTGPPSTRSRGASLRAPQATLIRFEQQLCLLIGTARYITLLIYPAGHTKRVLSAFGDLIAQADSAEPAPPGLLADLPPAADLWSSATRAAGAPASLPHAAAFDPPASGPARWEEPNQAALLSLRGFRIELGARLVLPDLSLDVASTGAYLLVTPEGGAKRLLVRALCGPRPASMRCSGSARYLGRDLLAGSGPATPQSGAALAMMTVCDYLISNLPDRDLLPRAAQRLKAQHLIEQARFPELLVHFDEHVINLAARERRILEILRAAAPRPALLVLDEPLAGVEPAARSELLALLGSQSSQRAILILAQDAEPFRSLDPRVGWLGEDRTQGSEPIAEGAPGMRTAAAADNGGAIPR